MDEQACGADVQRAAAGDADALQRLIIHYHPVLRSIVARATDERYRTRIEPEDILQQGYIAAFRSLGGCRFDGVPAFYKWIETIVLSKLRDEERALGRKKRDPARERAPLDASTSYPDLFRRVAGPESTPSRHVARDEAIGAVMSCLARLNDDQRAVVRLRFLEGRSVQEVATTMRKSEPAVHMLCHRALKALRELLDDITRSLRRP